MKKSAHFDTAKVVTAFFIMLVAFGVFLLFYQNSEGILQSDSFYPFIILSTIGFSLLAGLLYLVNNSQHPRVQKTAAKKHKKRK